jgi:hypothetical protein
LIYDNKQKRYPKLKKSSKVGSGPYVVFAGPGGCVHMRGLGILNHAPRSRAAKPNE